VDKIQIQLKKAQKRTESLTFSFVLRSPSFLTFSFVSKSKVLSVAAWSVLGGVVVIVMVRRLKETLMQVRERLKSEQAERTRKRIGELLGEAEQDSEGE
jgi:hypothetical protein